MKITIKAKGKASENNEEELQKQQQLEELQRIEAEKELVAKEKQAQIDSLLEHFEKEAADSPELIKDKESYFNSKEFDDLSNESFDFNKKRRAELEDRVVHLEDVYEQEKKKSKNTIPWRNYLVYLMIITSLSCCMTFSKYITTVDGSSSGTVANFDVSVYNGGRALAENSEQFELNFEEAKGDMPTMLTLKNNSDVTVKFIFTFTNTGGKHTFALTGNGVSNNTVEIKAGNSSDVVVHIYGATETVDETALLSIRAEQVD